MKFGKYCWLEYKPIKCLGMRIEEKREGSLEGMALEEHLEQAGLYNGEKGGKYLLDGESSNQPKG